MTTAACRQQMGRQDVSQEHRLPRRRVAMQHHQASQDAGGEMVVEAGQAAATAVAEDLEEVVGRLVRRNQRCCLHLRHQRHRQRLQLELKVCPSAMDLGLRTLLREKMT